jgi:hypothetical protein
MSRTTDKGDCAQAIITADLLRRGYKIALPLSSDSKFDLVAIKGNRLYRVQCKYCTSKDGVLVVRCRCTGQDNWTYYTVAVADIEWLAAYDPNTDACYYLPSNLLGSHGRSEIHLRTAAAKQHRKSSALWPTLT